MRRSHNSVRKQIIVNILMYFVSKVYDHDLDYRDFTGFIMERGGLVVD